MLPEVILGEAHFLTCLDLAKLHWGSSRQLLKACRDIPQCLIKSVVIPFHIGLIKEQYVIKLKGYYMIKVLAIRNKLKY